MKLKERKEEVFYDQYEESVMYYIYEVLGY